VIFNNIMQ